MNLTEDINVHARQHKTQFIQDVHKKNSINRIATTITLALLFINFKLNNLIGINSESNLNLFYFLLPALCILLPKYRSQFSSFGFIVAILFIFINLFSYLRFGFNFEGIRIVISILAYIAGYSLSTYYSTKDLSRIFSIIASLAIIIILMRWAIYPTETLSIYQGNRTSLLSYPYLTAGGHNIEVTYLIFLSLLCGNQRIRHILMTISAILSLLYMSRVGITLITLITVISLYKRLSFSKFIVSLLFCAFIIPSTLYLASPQTFERFTNIQQEVDYGDDGVGRIGLFNSAMLALDKNLWGYGTGNSLEIMRALTGINYRENNLHNIYLQILLDLGVVGFFLFFLLSAFFVYRCVQLRFSNTYQILATAYLLIGLIQFTGFDALGWLCLGLAAPSFKTYRNKFSTRPNVI